LSGLVVARKMPSNYIICDAEEPAMRAVCALDSGFFADLGNPLIAAGRGVPGFSGSAAFKATWINVIPAPEKRSKKGDLEIGRGPAVDRFHPMYALW
jgi:hypothetical protein